MSRRIIARTTYVAAAVIAMAIPASAAPAQASGECPADALCFYNKEHYQGNMTILTSTWDGGCRSTRARSTSNWLKILNDSHVEVYSDWRCKGKHSLLPWGNTPSHAEVLSFRIVRN
ncbi:peptidase inhibitor family I36 protein [Streptomyces lydicus]|uniref:peptidase inhibitor family I36 protein n=1 Tax=Streptomyces lydicus TaxID=47763 RepID=UPI0036EF0ECE